MSDAGWDEETREEEDVVDPQIGRVLGSRYRVEALLGKGAMGAVYRARHVKVGRAFAVKVLHERLLVDPKLRRRFEREAELAGKLHHINVIGVVDVGETEDGIHFMVMEFAEGQTLGSLVDGPMDPKRAISIAQQLCDGLQHAHEHGLIHRDFKPENVIVEKDRFGNERPRIVDFGIAILRDDADDPDKKDRLTTAGLVLGTPHYMAPEHAMGGGIDHRIDLFALGVIMYELLTGWLPFDGDGVDVARANLIAPTPAMGVRVPGVIVDPLLEAFTRLLMQKKPADRPETAKAARHLLDLIERDRPMAARILGVQLAEPAPTPAPGLAPTPAPGLAPTGPDEREMRAVNPDTRPPHRAAIASTPSTRARTVPERNPAPAHRAPSSLSMGAIPSQSIEPLHARSRWPLIAALGGAIAIAAVIVVVATRSSGRTRAATAPADAVTASVLDAAAVADRVQVDAMLAPEGSATATNDPPPAGSSQATEPTLPAGGSNAGTKPTDSNTPAAGTRPTGSNTPAAGTKTTGTKATGSNPTGADTTGTKQTGTDPTNIDATGTKQTGTKQTGTKQTGTKQTGTKQTGTKQTQGTTTPAPDTSSNAVATLYGVVGRELKALDTKRGADVAGPMWQRFRQLRINDALTTPEKRAAAERMLAQLRREIAAAM